MQDFDKPVSVGVVFDLSPSWYEGMRLLDHVKTALVTYVSDLGMSGKVYVSHPQWQQMPSTSGESTYFVASYEEPPSFGVEKAFKDAVFVVGSEPNEAVKYVFLFTDRFLAPNNYRYRKGFLMNQVRGFDTKIVVFGLGAEYDRVTLASVVEEYGGKYIHLENVGELPNYLREYNG